MIHWFLTSCNGFVIHQLSCNFNNAAKSFMSATCYTLLSALYNNMHLLRGKAVIHLHCLILFFSSASGIWCIIMQAVRTGSTETIKTGLIAYFLVRVMHVWLILLYLMNTHTNFYCCIVLPLNLFTILSFWKWKIGWVGALQVILDRTRLFPLLAYFIMRPHDTYN